MRARDCGAAGGRTTATASASSSGASASGRAMLPRLLLLRGGARAAALSTALRGAGGALQAPAIAGLLPLACAAGPCAGRLAAARALAGGPRRRAQPPAAAAGLAATEAGDEGAEEEGEEEGEDGEDGPSPLSTGLLMGQLGMRLPQVCCGCGVRLQQTDPDGPGFFQVPARLVQEAQARAAAKAAARPPPPADEAERAGRAFDAAAEAWLDARQRPDGGQPEEEPRDDGGEVGDDAPDVQCMRCFSLSHYGRIKSAAAELALPEFDLGKKVGRKIALQKDRRAVVLCVVDVADFDGSLPRLALRSLFPPGTGEELPEDFKFKIMVAVNKFDTLPEQATAKRVESWVRARLKQAGLPRPERVFMVSAVKGFGIRPMLDDLRSAMGFRADLWVVGAQNAGKSSLIAAMKRVCGTAGKRDPTIAPLPGALAGRLAACLRPRAHLPRPSMPATSLLFARLRTSSHARAAVLPPLALSSPPPLSLTSRCRRRFNASRPRAGTTLGLLRVPGIDLGPKHRVFDTPGVPHKCGAAAAPSPTPPRPARIAPPLSRTPLMAAQHAASRSPPASSLTLLQTLIL